jgi:hypothetical protein
MGGLGGADLSRNVFKTEREDFPLTLRDTALEEEASIQMSLGGNPPKILPNAKNGILESLDYKEFIDRSIARTGF